MRTPEVRLVDAFTTTPLAGEPVAVALHPGPLEPTTMRAIAAGLAPLAAAVVGPAPPPAAASGGSPRRASSSPSAGTGRSRPATLHAARGEIRDAVVLGHPGGVARFRTERGDVIGRLAVEAQGSGARATRVGVGGR